MSVSDSVRQEMLREVWEYNATPIGQPGDLTALDVVEDAKTRGRSLTRIQAAKWLRTMGEKEGWETELALINGRRMRIWRKPEPSKERD